MRVKLGHAKFQLSNQRKTGHISETATDMAKDTINN